MFSGKTTELIRRVGAYPPESVLAIKHTIDTRFGRDAIISHGGKAIPATPVGSSIEVLDRIDDSTRLAAIDEAHFFDPELPGVVAKLNETGIDVVLASLEPDSWARPFAINASLRRQAGEVVSLLSICAQCGCPADRTQRVTPVVNGNMVVDPSQYEPRCSECWKPPVNA